MKKRVVVLGAGVSGLSAAWRLRETHEVVVVEKGAMAGGWFAAAARTFRVSACGELLALAGELGLGEEIIYADEDARRRFVFTRGKLEEVPTSLMGFIKSPLLRGMRGAFLTEWRKPAYRGDETLFSFAERRFGKLAAERVFDALSLGVFGAESKKIFVEAAFPRLKEMERTHGSLTKAFFSREKIKKDSSLFSFRGGTKTLVDALVFALGECVHFEEEALSVDKKNCRFEVMTTKGRYEADAVVVALPPREAGRLLGIGFLRELEMTSLCMVQLGYPKELLPFKAFGYLVPTIEQLPLLGVIFDSCVFPSENNGMQTRLTAMLPFMEQAEEMAVTMMREHLGIQEEPSQLSKTVCKEGIFSPQLGHRQRIGEIIDSLEPNLALAGNYLLEGVSVNDCIRSGISAWRKVQGG